MSLATRAALVLAACLLAIGEAAGQSFSFSADKVDSVLAKGKERTVLEGRARVKSGALTITAQRIVITGKDYAILQCSGTVEALDEERGLKIQTPRLRYDRAQKVALMEGPSILEDRKNRVVLKANWIQHDGRSEIILAQVTVRILRESLACRSEYAVFRRGENYLELTGAPRVWKDGDEFSAERMIVNTETEEIRLEGAVQGLVQESSGAPTEPASGAPSGAAPGASSGAAPGSTPVAPPGSQPGTKPGAAPPAPAAGGGGKP